MFGNKRSFIPDINDLVVFIASHKVSALSFLRPKKIFTNKTLSFTLHLFHAVTVQVF